MWSVGAILYVLMTGGQRTFNTFENFNFKESVWTSCSQEIYDFMTQITISDPKKRPSAATLLSSSFITQSFTLEKEPLDYTLSEPGKAVLFRHNFSTLIDGLMCQFTTVELKRLEIKRIREKILSKKGDGPNLGTERRGGNTESEEFSDEGDQQQNSQETLKHLADRFGELVTVQLTSSFNSINS